MPINITLLGFRLSLPIVSACLLVPMVSLASIIGFTTKAADAQTDGHYQRKAIEGLHFLGGGEKVNSQAIDKEKKTKLGPGAPKYVSSGYLGAQAQKLEEQGKDLEKKGNLDEALKDLQKSLAIRQNTFGSVDKKIPELQRQMGLILVRQNKIQEAISQLSSALVSYVKFYGPGNNESIPTLIDLGTLYSKRSDYKNAYNSFKQAYYLERKAKGAKSPDTMRLRLQLAETAKSMKDDAGAADLFKETMFLYGEDNKILTHEQLQQTLEQYHEVLKNLKQDDEASKIAQRLEEVKKSAPPNAPATETK